MYVCKYFWPTNVGDNEVCRGATNVVEVDMIFWVEDLAGCDGLEGDDVPGHEDGAEEVAEEEEEDNGQESVHMVLNFKKVGLQKLWYYHLIVLILGLWLFLSFHLQQS